MEIERKFLIDSFPDNLKCVKTEKVSQGYININPEIRIRSYEYDNSKEYVLTIKSEGNLSRDEVEINIAEDKFNSILSIIGKPLIEKLYKQYQLTNGLILECSHVDAGSDLEFMYAEIEFKNEKEALEFIVPDFLGREVTGDPVYRMKNYWIRTRSL